MLNFSSNDYLGLANHPALKLAATQAIERYGAGAGASRLICGSLAVYHELDEALAAFKSTEAALSFSTGYAAALGTICAVAGNDDIIILDKLVHASIVDAARHSGAKLRVFAHNDLSDLEEKLNWAGKTSRAKESGAEHPNILVVTESVFSMDGDHAPLKEIVELKEKHGAWLMVDEAHGTGLYGPNRRGLAEHSGVSNRIEIQMGTLGKALGAAGGFICGSRVLIDYLINRARSFIFSTAPAPAAAAAATAGIRLVQANEGQQRQERLWQNVTELRASVLDCASPRALSKNLLPTAKRQRAGAIQTLKECRLPAPPSLSAIIPLIIGDETQALEAASELRERGIFVPAIRYPTVARGQARLRLTMTASHTKDEVKELLAAVRDLAFSL